ncbi:MAG: 50S ribosomal protein L6 [Planctomycetota bacterium]
MSRIGKQPVKIPGNVKVSIQKGNIFIEGPEGNLSIPLADEIEVVVDSEKKQILVQRKESDTKRVKALHGLTRALLANAVEGVTNQFVKKLTITGAGYGAKVESSSLLLDVGFCNSVNVPIPQGLTVIATAPRFIEMRSADKQLLGQFAAKVRSVRPPEPYKGKGIKYDDEVIRRKAAKTFVSGG